MDSLARAYVLAELWTLALPLRQKTLQLQRAELAPDHPDTLASLGELGYLHWRLKQFDRSIPLFKEKWRLQTKKLGRDHPETLGTEVNLGVNYRDAGQLKEAIGLLEEVHRYVKKYPELRWVVGQLAETYIKAGESAKFIILIEENLAEARKALPKDSPQLAGLLAQMGLDLLGLKKSAEAEPLLRESLAIREKKEPDDWRTFNTQSMLGGALLGQKKYADAEPLLLKGYEGMKAREKTIPQQGGAELRIPAALDRLIELYTALNKPDEAKKWQAERAKYPGAKKAATPEKK
jgi:hypothetical protein